MVSAVTKLRTIKVVHTAAWALFASAILLIPLAALSGAWRLTALLIVMVVVECVILAVNGMVCPLTPVAARYTTDRSANFDIYLPLWLARYNKQIFGSLFVIAVLFTIVLRLRS